MLRINGREVESGKDDGRVLRVVVGRYGNVSGVGRGVEKIIKFF